MVVSFFVAYLAAKVFSFSPFCWTGILWVGSPFPPYTFGYVCRATLTELDSKVAIELRLRSMISASARDLNTRIGWGLWRGTSFTTIFTVLSHYLARHDLRSIESLTSPRKRGRWICERSTNSRVRLGYCVEQSL